MKTTVKTGIFIAVAVATLTSCDFFSGKKPVTEDTATISTTVTGIEGDSADAATIAITTTTGTAE